MEGEERKEKGKDISREGGKGTERMGQMGKGRRNEGEKR